MIQLRVKTEYSFGETYAPIDRVIDRLKEQGCKAAGIVDESTWGHVEWFNKCKEAGIQPLLGVEIVVTDEDGDCPTPKMWFLAKNEEGLKELYRWGSKSYKQRISNRRASPRLFRDDVLEMSSNIIKFAGDVTDEKFIASFDCFLDNNPGSRVANGAKLAIAKKHNRRVVKTSDNAYSFEEDLEAFQFIERATQKPSPQCLIDLPECEVADEIANLCRDLAMPSAPMIRAEGNLETLCREGIKFRGMEECWSQQYEDRLKYELDLIESKDFTSYFLIVADMMCYAKEHMLVGPARGSSAGSLVCYLTRITEVDPIPPGLIFERFIDVTRTDLPDIDTDFPDNKRHMVFDYMEKKYGSRNTAHIGTVSRLKPKSALISVSKALGVPPQATGGVKAAMIERSSADSRANNCLEDTLRTTEPGKALLAMYPQIEMATKLEGHASHTGVHAAGLLVCNDEIQNYAIVDDKGIAHVEKGAAEKLGLLKIDVLGLRTLGVLEDSGVPIDWYGLKFDDPAVYDLFNSGRFCGVFQFEGNALRAVSGDVNFESLNEIDAVTALARPGPFGGGVTEEFCKRKKGKKYEPMHKLIDAHLKATFGLPVYQEQIMNIVRHVGQFSWKDTSTIRKTMSKRMGAEFFNTYFEKFREGAEEQGIGAEEARKTWDMINSFGAWCLSGETMINMAAPNQSTPRMMRLKDLAKVRGALNEQKPEKKAKVFSMHDDGNCFPAEMVDCFCSGTKETWLMTLADGHQIRATKEHEIYTTRGWVPLGELEVGDQVGVMVKRSDNFKFQKKFKGVGSGAHNRWSGDGHSKEFLSQTSLLKLRFDKCQSCLGAPYEETHHIDQDKHNNALSNLLPVCRKCHKKLHKEIGALPRSYDKGNPVDFSAVVRIDTPILEEVFDISMPDPNHNFVANGIVVHNCFNKAHSHSYAVVSYWTAYLKVHHPLEFAAANLRNAKDEDSAVELLREMVKEGLEYVPFDIELSEENWCAKNGKLYGGFMALKGIGEAGAEKYVKKRSSGSLTQKDKEKISSLESAFTDIFPFNTLYGDFYENPAKHAIVCDKIYTIQEIQGLAKIPHGEALVFLGEVVYKNARDANEDVNIKKRGGKVLTGQTNFADMRLRDDTGTLGARIGRFDWLGMKNGAPGGKFFVESVPAGSHLLIRAKFFNDIRFAFIEKWKVLK